MSQIEALRSALPDTAKDLKLNLQAVLRPENLSAEQVWGTAYCAALFLQDAKLAEALLTDAQAAGVEEAVFDDARAAAALMGMNTTFYRFRHLVEKESYTGQPARLRMTRMAQPKSDKATFELMSMACAVLAGCGLCIQSHEASLLQHGLTETHVNDVVRLASVLQGVSIALAMDTPVPA